MIRDPNMSVIANGKVIAQSHGEIVRYAFDRRWHELSPDIVVDSGTLFHPSPTGLEKLDRALVHDREAQRRALERVLDNPPSKDPAYLAALRTLGARAELVAEARSCSGAFGDHTDADDLGPAAARLFAQICLRDPGTRALALAAGAEALAARLALWGATLAAGCTVGAPDR